MELELDDDTNLASPFLRNILSDERPAPDFEGVTPLVVVTHMEMTNRRATEDGWANITFLTASNTVSYQLAVRNRVTNRLECRLGIGDLALWLGNGS